MDMVATFEGAVGPIFRFLLEDYRCRALPVARRPYGTSFAYRNRTTTARISLELRDNGIFVYLSPVVPRGKQRATAERPREILVDLLVKLRSGTHAFDVDPLHGRLAPEDVAPTLARYAEALRRYADDVLRGDFSVMRDVERLSQEALDSMR